MKIIRKWYVGNDKECKMKEIVYEGDSRLKGLEKLSRSIKRDCKDAGVRYIIKT